MGSPYCEASLPLNDAYDTADADICGPAEEKMNRWADGHIGRWSDVEGDADTVADADENADANADADALTHFRAYNCPSDSNIFNFPAGCYIETVHSCHQPSEHVLARGEKRAAAGPLMNQSGKYQRLDRAKMYYTPMWDLCGK